MPGTATSPEGFSSFCVHSSWTSRFPLHRVFLAAAHSLSPPGPNLSLTPLSLFFCWFPSLLLNLLCGFRLLGVFHCRASVSADREPFALPWDSSLREFPVWKKRRQQQLQTTGASGAEAPQRALAWSFVLRCSSLSLAEGCGAPSHLHADAGLGGGSPAILFSWRHLTSAHYPHAASPLLHCNYALEVQTWF